MKIFALVYVLHQIESMGLRCKGRYAMNINPFQVSLGERKGGMDFDLLTPLPQSFALTPRDGFQGKTAAAYLLQ